MAYRNPTLIEIIAETFLAPTTVSGSSTIAIANELSKIGLTQHEMIQHVATGPVGSKRTPEFVPRLRCWDSDKLRLVQISPGEFHVNLLGEYPGWDSFVRLAADAQKALVAAVGPDPMIETVNLIMIDKFNVPAHGFSVGRFLNVDGGVVPRWFKDVSAACDITLGQGSHSNDGYNKQVKIGVRPNDKDEKVEINMQFTSGLSSTGMDVVATLESLHQDAVTCFESVITDVVRETVLGGKR